MNTVGDRSFISDSKTSFVAERSYYYDKFENGATLYPRQFCFIDLKTHETFGYNLKIPHYETSLRAIQRAKKPYDDVKLKGNIETEFIYGTLTGSELVSFGTMPILPVILPLHVHSDKFILINKDKAKKMGKKYLFTWLTDCEKIWNEKRGEKATKMNLIDQLNYRKKIIKQNPKIRYRVIYNAAGTYLVSSVIDTKDIKYGSFIADCKTFYYETNNKDEAFFLSSILNSSIVDNIIKPMQSKGQFGERDVHKKPLELPIPKFNPTNQDHKKLAEIGKRCSKIVEKELPELVEKYKNLGKIRSKIRELLLNETKEIDKITEKVLSKTRRKSLSDFA